MADPRISQVIAEVISDPSPSARVSQTTIDLLSKPANISARISHTVIEVLGSTVVVIPPVAESTQFIVTMI